MSRAWSECREQLLPNVVKVYKYSLGKQTKNEQLHGLRFPSGCCCTLGSIIIYIKQVHDQALRAEAMRAITQVRPTDAGSGNLNSNCIRPTSGLYLVTSTFSNPIMIPGNTINR